MPEETNPAALAQTEAVRRLLTEQMDGSAVADYLFLEAWERDPSGSAGSTMRAGQIRRANPALAAEIRAEVTRNSAEALASKARR